MEILFSNGTDKLQITLPDRTLAAEEWFTAPLALQVGGLKFCISNDFQKEDFDFIFENLQKLLSDGIPVEFSQIEDVLSFTLTQEDALGHFRISIEIKTPETFIKTFFIMSYSDIERMLPGGNSDG
jgi:hypothetical protein